jgi:hypothetical protein
VSDGYSRGTYEVRGLHVLCFDILGLSWQVILTVHPSAKFLFVTFFFSLFFTVFELLMGNGDYFYLAETSPGAAAVFFFPFICIMFFVTLNVTIAVIMDG